MTNNYIFCFVLNDRGFSIFFKLAFLVLMFTVYAVMAKYPGGEEEEEGDDEEEECK